ncbi:MAG TPA: protein kinase [Gemmatimonadales bacterium]|jgi:serine/threonine-protein kinase|nr:protein kinase [Gemmatimonadales bacterium]
MECTKCHTPLPDNSRYCFACGADQTGGGDPAATSGQISSLMTRLQRIVEGKYKLERLLGKGGMGAVFLAKDLTLDRDVAIKVLPPDVSQDDHVIKRFQQEAKTAAKLDHTNIIPIYRVESEGGLTYFVMKYISGTSLEDLLEQKKPIPIEDIQRIIWQTAVALGHAHHRGIVHRDVKPANIMFDHDGKVMLTDFGISKALQAASGFTGTGMIIGTPHYMAPEQAKGQPVDGRADQYSLGVVGYRMITGALPFAGDSIHTILYKHIFEEPPPVRSVRPDIPEPLSTAIQRAMAKEPAQRYATMEEFATAVFPEQPVAAGRSGGPITPKPITRAPVTAESPTEAFISAPTTPIPSTLRPAAGAGAQTVPARPGAKPASASKQSGSKAWIGIAAAVVVLGGGGYLVFGRGQKPANDGQTATQQTPSNPVTNPGAVPPDTHTAVTPPVTPPQTGNAATQQPAQTATHKPAPAPHRSPPPAPKPAAQATGFVSIATDPIASVFIDNLSVGQSPLIGHEVPVGTHTIRVERVGFQTQSVTVQVGAGETVVRRLTLIQGG